MKALIEWTDLSAAPTDRRWWVEYHFIDPKTVLWFGRHGPTSIASSAVTIQAVEDRWHVRMRTDAEIKDSMRNRIAFYWRNQPVLATFEDLEEAKRYAEVLIRMES